MKKFLEAFLHKIIGVLSCFDRVVFRGHLPVSNSKFLQRFLDHNGVLYKDFAKYVVEKADRVVEHAKAFAARARRPYVYLPGYIRKEDRARFIAERDNVRSGLICVFAVLESCQSFVLRSGEGRPRLESARRKCLFLYFYFLDRDFGLMHVRLQTWFPFQIQVYVNAHEWLARKLTYHGIKYEQLDNSFAWIEDPERAQRFADRFEGLKWPRILTAFATRVNPLLRDVLSGLEYYWVTDQAEYATDVMFKSRAALQPLYAKLLRHSTLSFSAEDVLTFLGRKLDNRFSGEVLNDCKHRIQGARVKHRMKGNWIKMYDKHGCVLRIETVINCPREFRVFRDGMRKGEKVKGWYPLAKGVRNLYRYAQVSLQANCRYLDALASIRDPESSYKQLDRLCEPAKFHRRKVSGFNPLSKADTEVFAAVMRGEHAITGFRNRDLQMQMCKEPPTKPEAKRRLAARVTRLIQRLRAHGLLAKVPRARLYRVTPRGYTLMSAALQLREEGMPQILQNKA